MHRRTTTLLLLALAVFLSAGRVLAGGGSEFVLLVVNGRNAASKTIANYFVEARRVPQNNIFYLDWKLGESHITVEQFRNELLKPIQEFLQKRKLAGQIDCIVYSSGFPYGINFHAEVPPQVAKEQLYQFPTGSLTGMTYSIGAVMTKNAANYGPTAWNSNRYMRQRESLNGRIYQLPIRDNGQFNQSQGYSLLFGEDDPVDPTSLGSHGFRSWYGWGQRGELLEAGGNTYILSAMLGVTYGRGNRVSEVVNYLRESPAADGTFPKGTIYFMDNPQEIRSKTRRPGFQMAVDQLTKLGVRAQIVPGDVPRGRRDVQGLLCGVADFNWPGTGSTILRGAICDNLTSYGGMFNPKDAQTPCTEFLKFGAIGTSGTVAEPFSQQAKFAHAMVQVHYARGCNMVESYYQSVSMPYQLLILGDPLCRPWANIPKIKVTGISEQTPVTGTVTLRPSAEFNHEGECDRFELIIDGQRRAACAAGGTLDIDSTKYSDGYHQVRVVGFERGPIETQGVVIINAQFNNFGRTIEFTATPQQVSAGRKITVTAKCPTVDGVAVYQNGQLVATIAGEEGAQQIESIPLGDGPVTLTAVGWKDGKEVVSARPVKLFIQNGVNNR